MMQYTKEERAFLLCHELFHALFAAATDDDAVYDLMRRRLIAELPAHIAGCLLEVINHTWEIKNDLQHQDQSAS